MLLQINPQTTIRELNKAFTAAYPFLKLEFYRKKHGLEEGSAGEQIDHDKRLDEVNRHLKKGAIPLRPEDTVGDVEQRFRDGFGLSVQVFRKAGNVWLETTKTDHLSLREQNEIGKEAGQSFRNNIYTLFL
jgi:hypothetical protein